MGPVPAPGRGAARLLQPAGAEGLPDDGVAELGRGGVAGADLVASAEAPAVISTVPFITAPS